jgi:hypothetical protein
VFRIILEHTLESQITADLLAFVFDAPINAINAIHDRDEAACFSSFLSPKGDIDNE